MKHKYKNEIDRARKKIKKLFNKDNLNFVTGIKSIKFLKAKPEFKLIICLI